MNNDKSPGNVGITNQFYIKVCEVIIEPFFPSIQQSFIVDEQSTSQKQSGIKLIQKKIEIKDSLKTRNLSHFLT